MKPRGSESDDASGDSRWARTRTWMKAVWIVLAAIALAVGGLIAGQINVDVMN
ncbi:hypothetical protein [Naasia lichenicola]|uniref:hypothetical protein n=1 Tax=Naasia lichenicola TaxID=2565933 RepID=UPI00130E7BB5|nr:hypothetical protein [Naasia lichenicola]